MTITITEANKYQTLAANVVAREHEVFGYQINIDNYTAMLEAFPKGEWPENLVGYKGITGEQLFDTVPVELQQQVSDLQYRDRVQRLLASEKIEQSKSKRVYDALLSQLPVTEASALVQEAAVAAKAAVSAAKV